jgi:hypothetical protein
VADFVISGDEISDSAMKVLVFENYYKHYLRD